MSQFSILLSEFITSKDIPVYPLTQYCSLDRSTIYKYIGGKRLPPRQELVEKIADYMRLSPSEREKLITAWNIENVGADTYFNRQNVRDFILNFPDISKISPVIAPPLSLGVVKTDLPACGALTSLSEVNAGICRIILKEAEKKMAVWHFFFSRTMSICFIFSQVLANPTVLFPLNMSFA